jgi:hypothetical protein
MNMAGSNRRNVSHFYSVFINPSDICPYPSSIDLFLWQKMDWGMKASLFFRSIDYKMVIVTLTTVHRSAEGCTGEPYVNTSLQGRDMWTLGCQGMHELEVTRDRWCCKSIVYSLSPSLFREVYGSAEKLQQE